MVKFDNLINQIEINMTTTISTTKEQSGRLIACGVSVDTADMVWTRFESDVEKYEQLGVMDESAYEVASLNPTPAWSLGRLLDILPKHLDSFPMTKWYPPFIDEYDEIEAVKMDTPSVLDGDVKLSFYGKTWAVDYDWGGFMGYIPQSESPIEAVVLAIELLHANGYKFNEIK